MPISRVQYIRYRTTPYKSPSINLIASPVNCCICVTSLAYYYINQGSGRSPMEHCAGSEFMRCVSGREEERERKGRGR